MPYKLVRHLYVDKKLNTREIGEIIGKNKWAVMSYMRRHNIPRRTSSESKNLLYLKQTPSYNMKKNLTNSERILQTSALMLYWAEGAKGDHVVDFANSDVNPTFERNLTLTILTECHTHWFMFDIAIKNY